MNALQSFFVLQRAKRKFKAKDEEVCSWRQSKLESLNSKPAVTAVGRWNLVPSLSIRLYLSSSTTHTHTHTNKHFILATFRLRIKITKWWLMMKINLQTIEREIQNSDLIINKSLLNRSHFF